MKYLKRFEDLNTHDNIISDLKDICLELSDNGFTIDIVHGSISSYVTIYKPNKYNSNYKEFDTNEISETLDRIEEYLGDKWVDTSLSKSGSGYHYSHEVNTKVIIAEVEFKLANKNPYFNIKPFSESKGMKDTIEDIKDICLELQDNGFFIEVNGLSGYQENEHWQQILIGKNKDMDDYLSSDSYDDLFDNVYYKYEEVRDVVERLKQYLGDKLIAINICSYDGSLTDDDFDTDNDKLVWNKLNNKVDAVIPNYWYLYNVYAVKIEFTL